LRRNIKRRICLKIGPKTLSSEIRELEVYLAWIDIYKEGREGTGAEQPWWVCNQQDISITFSEELSPLSNPIFLPAITSDCTLLHHWIIIWSKEKVLGVSPFLEKVGQEVFTVDELAKLKLIDSKHVT
jgi:hypothetical protein